MSRKLELLAPGGDVEAIKAAIVAGANAVYCGLQTFNARNRASNLSLDELHGILRLAHSHHCEVFLTMNVVILEQEIAPLVKLLNQLANTGIDGIIVQDLGVFNIVNKHFPHLAIHASTQLTTHNEGQIKFLSQLGATRVNLSRELNLPEIKSLTAVAHENDVLTEVFVHGALCIAFSGQCYSSSVSVGNSGNRGRCSQACRDEYEVTPAGNSFPLNLKDNSAYFDLPELVEAKVDSLKVEGRIKGAHYVYTVVDTWRKQINQFIENGELLSDDSNLHKVFNRSFTNKFLQGKLSKDMFIDNPRDSSVDHAVEQSNASSAVQIHDVKQELYQDKNQLGDDLAEKVKDLSIEKHTLLLSFIGKAEDNLKIIVKTPEHDFTVTARSVLRAAEEKPITADKVAKRFNNITYGKYILADFDFSQYDENATMPFSELSTLREEIETRLNNGVAPVKHVDVPALKQHAKVNDKPTLSLLIADEKDAYLTDITDADIYFKLPESFKRNCTKYIDILNRNTRFIPWFPAVLIGKDYEEAVKVLEQVKPKRIVTNNTGIAYKAYELGIEWVAGPFMNTTNSHALVTLKESLNCAGAFISNEINKLQIRNIKRPENFKLFYSIYHPILMMTSRQCFFQRTVGCNKPAIEDGCMLKCEKATTITNLKGTSFAVDKQKGGYPSIYNNEQFLNMDVVGELSGLFDEFFIDLTNIGAGSKKEQDKAELITQFEKLLSDDGLQQNVAKDSLDELVPLATNQQYMQGL